ncbi:MAG TPA: DUF5694 domain-containing protein, partial [Longimicrobiales bacterium]|nr:DUF5694 domain-containing protein [Longimicrobiales bacterium]
MLRAQTPDPAPAGMAPLVWPACHERQARVMILGSYHFEGAAELDDIRRPARQAELRGLVARLAGFAPHRVAVEYPWARRAALDSAYEAYLGREPDAIESRNEIDQLGFRLARALGHSRVYAVDVPMNLWDDSIAVFDERWPDAREGLRTRWDFDFEDHDASRLPSMTLGEALALLNGDLPPGNSEMYGNFLPLVQDEVYAGALKLRPWYDRNMRIVQNLFRSMEATDEKVVLLIGSGHLRVLKQIMEMTPQLCPVSALP